MTDNDKNDFFEKNRFDRNKQTVQDVPVEPVTDKHRFNSGMRILGGLGALFSLTLLAYMINPERGAPLIEVCRTALPPLATLIIAFYFKDRC